MQRCRPGSLHASDERRSPRARSYDEPPPEAEGSAPRRWRSDRVEIAPARDPKGDEIARLIVVLEGRPPTEQGNVIGTRHAWASARKGIAREVAEGSHARSAHQDPVEMAGCQGDNGNERDGLRGRIVGGRVEPDGPDAGGVGQAAGPQIGKLVGRTAARRGGEKAAR